MTPGSRSRRIAVGIAMGTITALGGCHGVPVTRLMGPPPIPNRPQSVLGSVGRAALLPATVALESPSEMAAIDPSNSATGTVTRTSALGTGGKATLISTEPAAPVPEPAQPTPLLDAALVRARDQGDPAIEPASTIAATAGPQPVPASSPEAVPTPTPLPVASAPAPMMTSSPVSEAKPVEAIAPPVAPEEAWREGVRKLVGLARSRQEQAGSSSPEPWGLRSRVLAWLAEPDIDPDLGARDADGVRAVLHALESTVPGDHSRTAGATLGRGDDIRTAIQTLEARAPLDLVDLQICQEVRGFGDLTAFESLARRPGEMVVLYCEVEGLHKEPTSGGYETRLAGRLEILAEDGSSRLAVPLDTARETTPRRRRDYFIGYPKFLPATLSPGRYTIRVTVTDVFTERTASRSLPLVIARPHENVASTPHDPAPAP